MPRKPARRRAKGDGGYHYDKKTGRHRWRITVNGKQYEVADRDPDRAATRFAEIKAQLAQGVKIADGKQTLTTFAEYCLNRVFGGRESTKLDRQRRIRSYITPVLGDRRLCDLNTPEIRDWLAEIDAIYARSSVKQALGLLKRILDLAVAERLIAYNPAAHVRMAQQPAAGDDDHTQAGRPMTPEQLRAFLSAAQGEALELLFVLAARLGLRRGEALGLRWQDYDSERKTIAIRQAIAAVGGRGQISPTKNSQSRRTLPLPEDIIALLNARREAQTTDHELIFCSQSGQPINPRNLLRSYYRVQTRAGLDGFRFHDLRHTANQMMADAGVAARTRAAILGHAGVQITEETYTHASLDAKREAIDRVKNGR